AGCVGAGGVGGRGAAVSPGWPEKGTVVRGCRPDGSVESASPAVRPRSWWRSDERHDPAVLGGGQRLVEKSDHVLEFDAGLDRLRRDALVLQDVARSRARADLRSVLDRIPEDLPERRVSGELDFVP